MQRKSKQSEEGWLLSYADLITNLLIFFVMLLTASNMSQAKFQQIAKSVSGQENPQSLESIQKEVDKKIKDAGLEKMVSTTLTEEGLNLSLNSGVVFDMGSAVIRPEWDSVLTKILSNLASYSKKYGFAVEGHTDSLPIAQGGKSKFPSNWELSSARAIEVRRRLEETGIDRHKIRIEAYADIKPLPAKEIETLSEDEKLARHRRVVVRIY